MENKNNFLERVEISLLAKCIIDDAFMDEVLREKSASLLSIRAEYVFNVLAGLYNNGEKDYMRKILREAIKQGKKNANRS